MESIPKNIMKNITKLNLVKFLNAQSMTVLLITSISIKPFIMLIMSIKLGLLVTMILLMISLFRLQCKSSDKFS